MHCTQRKRSGTSELAFYDKRSKLNETADLPKSSICGTCNSEKGVHVVSDTEMKNYFKLLEEPMIAEFLRRDRCFKLTDKYMLAMVFVYFKRVGYKKRDFTRLNFFVGLFLAHDMEEDEEEIKYEIFPWALGNDWRNKYSAFLLLRDEMWNAMDHRAVVSRRCCEEVISMEPCQAIWQRERPPHHGGAVRAYTVSEQEQIPRGPSLSPLPCSKCSWSKNYDEDFRYPVNSVYFYSSSSSETSSDNRPAVAASRTRRLLRKYQVFRGSSSFSDMDDYEDSSSNSSIGGCLVVPTSED